MGVEVLKIDEGNTETAPQIQQTGLAELAFQSVNVPQPAMSIWMMQMPKGKPVLPWWGYNPDFEKDIETLAQMWKVSSAQKLFDLLFFNQFHRVSGPNVYVIFPGNIKTHGWRQLREADQSVYLRGQGCVYHLEGGLSGKLGVNWVPFYQPQSMVKNPHFDSLWRLYQAKLDEEDDVNCLSFFSLSDPKRLPEVVRLLIDQNDQRSVKLSKLVDWFGVYSSPLKDRFGTACVVYAENEASLLRFRMLEEKIRQQTAQIREELAQAPKPQTALRILNRHTIL